MSYREALSVERQQVLDAYRVVDVAFKVVGTGSVGTRDYIVLLLGSRADDSLFLQIKEELPSCYVPYLRQAPPFPHQGRRVAEGQRRLQTATDPFVGWTSIGSGDYLVRERTSPITRWSAARSWPRRTRGRVTLLPSRATVGIRASWMVR